MILLALRDSFQQSFVGYFLEQQGYVISHYQEMTAERQSLKEPQLVLTDDSALAWSIGQAARVVWIVDCGGGFSLQTGLPEAVRGVLCSQSNANELLTCLRLVEQGKQYLSGELLQTLGQAEVAPNDTQLNLLSKREREVFNLIGEGLSMSKIADKLFISVHTAENHRANIQKKLSLSGRLSLVRFAATVAIKRK